MTDSYFAISSGVAIAEIPEDMLHFSVGQIVNLRPIGNRPAAELGRLFDGPISNRPQINNLPHTAHRLTPRERVPALEKEHEPGLYSISLHWQRRDRARSQ